VVDLYFGVCIYYIIETVWRFSENYKPHILWKLGDEVMVQK